MLVTGKVERGGGEYYPTEKCLPVLPQIETTKHILYLHIIPGIVFPLICYVLRFHVFFSDKNEQESVFDTYININENVIIHTYMYANIITLVTQTLFVWCSIYFTVTHCT